MQSQPIFSFFLRILASALLLTGAACQPSAPSPAATALIVTPGSAQTQVAAGLANPTDPQQPYEMISTTALRAGQVTLAIKEFTLNGQLLRLTIQARGPVQVLDNPGAPLQPLVREVQVLAGAAETPLEIEATGGSGGSTEDGLGGLTVEESLEFEVKNSPPPGSSQPLLLLVTFNEGFGFNGPVRFELDTP